MKILNLFVEGPDDKIFFNSKKINELLISRGYDSINIIEYKRSLKNSIIGFIATSVGCPIYDFVFVSDKDRSRCISSALDKNAKTYRIRDKHKIVIVNQEIESWYLAGMSDSLKQKYRQVIPTDTQHICKEEFETRYVPAKIDKFSLMIEIMENYDIERAKSRNKSFKYFINRLDDKILNQYYCHN